MSYYFNAFLDALEGHDGWLIEMLTMVALVIAINIGLKWVLLKLHDRFQAKNQIWKDTLVVALIPPLTSLVWLIAAIQFTNFLYCKVSNDSLIHSPHAIFKGGLIVATAWFLLRWKKAIVHKLRHKNKKKEIAIDFGRVDALDKLATLAIYALGGLLFLEQIGGSMNTLIAFGGVSGLAVAFASQQIIANFFGGILIYFTKPFIVGDWIKIPEKSVEGDVEEIGWYTTLIRAFDKQPIYVPNSLLTNVLVINPSRMTYRQFKEVVAIRYQDLPLVPAIVKDLEESLAEYPMVPSTHLPEVHLTAFGAYAVEIQVSVYTTAIHKNDFSDVAQDLLLKISEIILKHGADFAIPIQGIEFPKGLPLRKSHD